MTTTEDELRRVSKLVSPSFLISLAKKFVSLLYQHLSRSVFLSLPSTLTPSLPFLSSLAGSRTASSEQGVEQGRVLGSSDRSSSVPPLWMGRMVHVFVLTRDTEWEASRRELLQLNTLRLAGSDSSLSIVHRVQKKPAPRSDSLIEKDSLTRLHSALKEQCVMI